PAFLVAGGPWVRPAPGLPCALVDFKGAMLGTTRADHAAGTYEYVSLEHRHCERSEAIHLSFRGKSGSLRPAPPDTRGCSVGKAATCTEVAPALAEACPPFRAMLSDRWWARRCASLPTLRLASRAMTPKEVRMVQQSVGWVERSETHQPRHTLDDGFRCALP